MASTSEPPRVVFPAGVAVPSLGLGTWRMAEEAGKRAEEIAAIHLGLDLGMTVVDTAEMYGDGMTEKLVGDAIAGRRGEVFLVSKVLPSHARRDQTLAACDASLKRLGTDYLDLYLLHWRGRTPLRETVDAFIGLQNEGKIRQWGVSNFELSDMEELLATPGGSAVACNQVLYNLRRRGIEFDLLPWCQERGIPVMAYSPVEQGELLRHKAVKRVASTVGATPAQLCLAWVLRQPGVIAIPKAGTREHVRENHESLGIQLGDAEIRALDDAFPPPRKAQPLEML